MNLKGARSLFIVAFAFGNHVCVGQYNDSPKFVVFGGAGLTNQYPPTRTTVHFGADLEEVAAVPFGQVPFGLLVEGGYAGPAKSFSGSALFSANYMGAFFLKRPQASPRLGSPLQSTWFFTGGYTRLFGTGNAVNFGGGIDLVLKGTQTVRFEVRDYMLPSTPSLHDVGLRVGYILYIPD